MKQEDLDKLKRLTQTQALFLTDLVKNRTITANASGASNVHFSGKIVAGIRKQGIIEPFGYKGRQTIWSFTPEWEEKVEEDKETLFDVLNKIGNAK